MAGVENTLYPPVLATYMPAFLRTDKCRIYFSLSDFNDESNIVNVQVAVFNQATNATVLAERYTSEIMIKQLQVDITRTTNRYFIDIFPSDLINGFEVNQFYKVQLRFTGAGASAMPSEGNPIEQWLTSNQKFFSEWSRICLTKGIDRPILYLKGFSGEGENETTTFTKEVIDIIGQLSFKDPNERETLNSFNIKIYETNNDVLIYDSGIIYTNSFNPNEINYNIKYNLQDAVSYRMNFVYNTRNGYSENKNFSFIVVQSGSEKLNADISATPNYEDGSFEIRIKKGVLQDNYSTESKMPHLANLDIIESKNDSVPGSNELINSDISAPVISNFIGSITIRRSSSETNFTIWEDIHTFTLLNQPLDYRWKDYTVKSGVWYKYCAQTRSSKGIRGIIISIPSPVMMVFNDIYLTRENMQIKIKYNPNISSYKHVVAENKIETIGSKYPFIQRNGNVNYRQFSIAGLISAFSDESGIFLNKQNIYGESYIYYDSYNKENNIIEHRDYTYEREFREKIISFLYDNTVKLFRSATEGNILVKLMDISFTPNQTLGRMLYSFTATAQEIDECSIENFDFYKIQTIKSYMQDLTFTNSVRGQLYGTYGSSDSIFRVLNEKHRTNDNFIASVKNLQWIRVQFESDPYMIGFESNGNMSRISTSNANDSRWVNKMYGYLLRVNGKNIFIPPTGYYELNDFDIVVTDIGLPFSSTVLVDYIANISFIEDEGKVISKLYYFTKVGQIAEKINADESIIKKIENKYLLKREAFYQQVASIDDITIEAVPGAIFSIQDSGDSEPYSTTVGQTGILHIHDPNFTFTNCYLNGVYLVKSKEVNNLAIRENSFILAESSHTNVNQIKNPRNNEVFRIGNDYKIYYHDQWYPVEFNSDKTSLIIKCPLNLIIDYVYEIERGDY